MKIIDLLNKIANGEEVPNFIVDEVEYYMGANGYLRECMGDDTQWYIDKSWLNTEVQILEEEKKIPEKLKIEQDTPSSNYYIRNENGTKCGLTKHSKMIAETLNQVIDYLKSKGDE